jgi:hypothetical protein
MCRVRYCGPLRLSKYLNKEVRNSGPYKRLTHGLSFGSGAGKLSFLRQEAASPALPIAS